MRTLGLRRVGAARGGGARRRPATAARRLLRRPQRGGRGAPRRRRPSSSSSASTSSPGARRTCWPAASSSPSGSRPTGSGSCCAPTWSASSARSEPRRSTRPIPKGNPIVLHPGQGFDGDGLRLAEQIGRVRDQIGLAAAASGSNNWAVSPSRSATGGALLAGDPHLPSGMPGVWYEVGLELDGRFCRGASIPGLPGISLGQNNDVAFAFTNVMADVEDLFVERIEDESYEFEGEQRPLEIVEELISSGGRTSPSATRSASPTTARSSTRRSARTTSSRSPCAGRRSTSRRSHTRTSGCSSRRSGPELVEMLRTRDDARLEPGLGRPARIDRLQDDGPDPEAEGRLPRPAEARLDRRVRVGRLDPLRRAARAVDPEEGYIVTANNRVVDDSYPHHITSDWLDGYRARADRAAARGRPTSTTSTSFRRMQTDLYSIPGDEVVHRLARLEPTSQREVTRDRAAEELGPEARAPDRSRGRSIRRSCCGSRGSSPARRSATATSPTATSTAPTTASSRTSPRRGAGTPTSSTSGRRATRS